MQEPLLRADLDLDQRNVNNMPNGPNVPDVVRSRGGWYPRWWLLSSTVCSLLAIAGYILWHWPNMTCVIHQGPFVSLCRMDKWPLWGQELLVIPGIWLIFLVFWGVALMFGMPAIEIPKARYSTVARGIRAISEFRPIHPILLVYGVVALVGIIVMWYQQTFDPTAFAIASIVVFLAHCSFFQRITPEERKWYLSVYGLAALGGIAIMFVFGRFQEAIFVTEVIIFGIGVWAFFFWQPQPVSQLTAQDQLDANLARIVTPMYILRSTWPMNRLFPNRPIRTI